MKLSVPCIVPKAHFTSEAASQAKRLHVPLAEHLVKNSLANASEFLVRLMRFERTAHSVGGCCSIQLSYRRILLNILKADRFYYPLYYYIIFFLLFQAYFKSASQAASFTATQNTSIAIASSSVVGYVGAILMFLSSGSIP